MTRTVVRYTTRPERTEENQQLIEAVFQELAAKTPDGVRYLVLKVGDGSFVHFVEVEGEVHPLRGLAAFQAFQSGARERCLEGPQSAPATIVGNYRMLR